MQVDLAEKSMPGRVYNVCSNRAVKVRFDRFARAQP